MLTKRKKCNCISLGKINKYIVLILLDALFYFIRIIIEDHYKFIKGENLHPIIYNLSHSLGSSLSFILFIIYHIRNKREINPIFAKENNTEEKSLKTKFLWILLVSIISFISSTLNAIFWINNDNYINIWSSYIIFLSLFSFLVLKNKLYKHHYISIIIIIILGLLYNLVSPQINIDKYLNIYLITISNSIIYSFEYVLYKYLMLKKFIKSYEILFFRGIIVTVLLIITLIITTKIGKIDNFLDFCENSGAKEIIIFISMIIINFIYYLFFLIIIDIFSPFHLILVNFIADSLTFFYYITSYDFISAIFNIIFISIEIFLILVFIEIIELNFWGLSKMIKRNIELRANLEVFKGEDIDDANYEKKLTIGDYEIELRDVEKPDEKNVSDY